MRVSKPVFIPVLVLLIMTISGLSACRQNVIQGVDDEGNPSQLTITIKGSGYRQWNKKSTNQGLQTRDNDMSTEFTEDDTIGIYVVRNGQCIVSNLRAKKNYTGWETDPSQPPLKLFSGATYYAYFPYRPTFNPGDEPDLSASDASQFFANLIAHWQPSADQHTHDLYAASDLMVAKGELNERTLNFRMIHQMGLIELEFQAWARYVFDKQSNIPDYMVKAGPPQPTFDQFSPLHTNLYEYRYLLNVPHSEIEVRGGYEFSGDNWNFRVANLASGSYWVYNIGSKDIITSQFPLQPGDFIFHDGNLRSKDIFLDEVYKDSLNAIVVKAGREETDTCHYSYKQTATPMTAIHGYAVDWLLMTDQHDWLVAGADDPKLYCYNTAQFDGYANTRKVVEYCEQQGIDISDYSVMFDDCTSDLWHSTPVASSGWYMPSIGQLLYLDKVKDVVLTSALKKDSQAQWYGDFASSCEDPNDPDPDDVPVLELIWDEESQKSVIYTDRYPIGLYSIPWLTF